MICDEATANFIIDIKPRLRTLIEVEPVLDRMPSIDKESKERIRNKLKTDCNLKAADLLIDTVVKEQHRDRVGWFREFVDALSHGGCQFAADYVEAKLPDPGLEAENDCFVRLIELLSPTLVDMKTDDVCMHCFAEGILTEDDKEIISAEKTNNGNKCGARELLRRIVRAPPGWFSTFQKVLCDTEQSHLCKELTGGSIYRDNKEAVPGNEQQNVKVAEPAEEMEQGAWPTEEPQNVNLTEETAEEMEQDLYSEGNSLVDEDGAEATTDPEGRENTDIVLRDYQMDVAGPALEGKNIIICLPTGSGKTRVAVYITKEHLDTRKRANKPAKVVVLVNKIPLVDQHYNTEFGRFLKHHYKIERVSGDSQLKISFTEIVKNNDVIICTAQILENYLERSNGGDDEGVMLSDLTLIVIDECHHTQKGGVYNHIMMRYLKEKHRNLRRKKEQKELVPIPQILGLTASPGVDGATKMKKAEDHILRICANLDAYKIMTTDISSIKKEPRKNIATVDERKQDPFGDVIKSIMNAIHVHANLSPTCDLGSQNYEQWVVNMERQAAKEEDQKVRVSADHLRQYNEALQLSNTIRMSDALSFLTQYQDEELKRKVAPEEEQPIQITDTEKFLFKLFRDKKAELQKIASITANENNSLSELRRKILQEFTSRQEARGIIFTKTRRSAIALNQWIQQNPKFYEVGVKSAYVIGGGDQSSVKPMTATEQNDVLKKFRTGKVNLLIATTVAEEGLDIPQCNFVIRYGLVTNEIAMIQAQGRGRAEDSSYIVVEVAGSGVAERETVNVFRKNMMDKAISKIKDMDEEEYGKMIMDFQIQAILEEKLRNSKKEQKDMKNDKPSMIKFSCRGCNKHICTGQDIQVIEDIHRVNVTAEFRGLFIKKENTSLQKRNLDNDANWFIFCKDCGQRWGSMMLYRGIDCPCLHVKNFLVMYAKKNRVYTQWGELAIRFPAFDYAEQAHSLMQSSDDDD